MTTPATAPRQPMTSFQKTVVVLLVALVLAVVAAIITVSVIARNASIDEKKADCQQYPAGSVDYFYCMDLADN